MDFKDYEYWEKKNEKYLEEFAEYLEEKGFKEATVRRHYSNVIFFLNNYLGVSNQEPMEAGPEYIADYFGYYFIKKCMWSTPKSIKTTIASVKKFYKLMVDNGHLKQAAYDDMVSWIEDEQYEWMNRCARYNDPDYDWDPATDWFE